MRKTRKPLAAGIALALVATLGVGATIAWLTDKSGPVTNTFTVGDVEISLTESPLNEDGTYDAPQEGVSNAYQMIPGTTYTKDPRVTVDARSEDCILFVEFIEDGNSQTYLNYTSTLTPGNGWTQGDGEDIPSNVWYRTVEKTAPTKSWNLLADDEITVDPEAVTKESMEVAVQAKLTYTAYAVQLYKSNDTPFAPAEAWARVAP